MELVLFMGRVTPASKLASLPVHLVKQVLNLALLLRESLHVLLPQVGVATLLCFLRHHLDLLVHVHSKFQILPFHLVYRFSRYGWEFSDFMEEWVFAAGMTTRCCFGLAIFA